MRWALRPTRMSDVRVVAASMREIDRMECAALGKAPKRALYEGWKRSSWCLTALYEGKPAAIFGVVPTNAICDVGAPWMLCTDDARFGARALKVMGPALIQAMHDEWGYLENCVGADNRKAIRLLQALGFVVEDEIMVVGDLPMRKFWRKAR